MSGVTDQQARDISAGGQAARTALDTLNISALTIDSITGTDSSLDIAGQDAAQGGAIPVKGGDSSTAANAGGAASLTGGDAGATGVGGAASTVGGIGGATSGAGGVAALTGGAATAGNSAGGASDVAGGAGQGTSAGGAATLTGGAAENGAAVNPGASGAATLASGAAGTATSGTAGASGAASLQSAAGGAATLDNATGGASGTVTVASGVGGAITLGNGAGGAAGLVSITGGAGGADTEASDGTGGAGAAVVLQAGVGGTGNTAGQDAQVHLRSAGDLPVMRKIPAHTTATDTASLTDAQITSGIIVATPTATATYTMRTGTQIEAYLGGDIATGDSFDLTIINLGGAGDIITMAVAAGVTFQGSLLIDDAGADITSSATYRIRRSAANTFVCYRIA